MRHVYSNHEIPHLWAHQSQNEARNSSSSLYFVGPTIYSYGSHFPIARHVTNNQGECAILFTIARYSVTTSGHCSAVARAIPSNVPIFHVAHVQNGSTDLPNHRDNVENYLHRLSELLNKARRARVYREHHEREALALREELRGYVAFFNVQKSRCPKIPHWMHFKHGLWCTKKRSDNARRK
jgi:hypothetical protein